MKALILAADGFEDLELYHVWYRLQEEGVQVTLASPAGKTLTGAHGYRASVDMPISEINPSEYDLLVLPGGAGSERLRLREEAVGIVRTFMDEGRRVAALGRGPQLLISAGSLSGRQATCDPFIRDDLRAAGAADRDEPVVIDDNLITCRGCADLPEFSRQLIHLLKVSA